MIAMLSELIQDRFEIFPELLGCRFVAVDAQVVRAQLEQDPIRIGPLNDLRFFEKADVLGGAVSVDTGIDHLDRETVPYQELHEMFGITRCGDAVPGTKDHWEAGQGGYDRFPTAA